MKKAINLEGNTLLEQPSLPWPETQINTRLDNKHLNLTKGEGGGGKKALNEEKNKNCLRFNTDIL